MSPRRRFKYTILHNVDDQLLSIYLHPRVTKLCFWTRIFNNVEVLNLIKKSAFDGWVGFKYGHFGKISFKSKCVAQTHIFKQAEAHIGSLKHL